MVHTVVRGESLSLIARKYGVDSWRRLYDHPDNASFRMLRPNPNLIYPGDRIAIPSSLRSGSTGGSSGSSRPTGGSTGGSAGTRPAGPSSPTPPSAPDPVVVLAPPEPASISPDEIRNGAPLPDRFLDFLAKVLGVRRNELNRVLDSRGGISRYADGAQALAELYLAYRAFENARYLDGTTSLLTGTAGLWNVMPAAWRQSASQSMGRIIGRIPKLAPLGQLIPRIDAIGAYPEVAGLFAALLKGDGKAAGQAAGAFVHKLREHPAEAVQLCPRLIEFLLGLIPPRMKAKMAAKMAGRKVPVVGTIVVGVTDLFQIVSKPSDWSGWVGLGSTLAGLVPVAGTALSVVLDVGIVLGTIIENINDLDLKVQEDPTGV